MAEPSAVAIAVAVEPRGHRHAVGTAAGDLHYPLYDVPGLEQAWAFWRYRGAATAVYSTDERALATAMAVQAAEVNSTNYQKLDECVLKGVAFCRRRCLSARPTEPQAIESLWAASPVRKHSRTSRAGAQIEGSTHVIPRIFQDRSAHEPALLFHDPLDWDCEVQSTAIPEHFWRSAPENLAT
jgi:hypothetical protein